MTDPELELRILQKYVQHYDAVGLEAPKCERELDMKKVISDIIGRPAEEPVVQRWHSRLAPPSSSRLGILRPCSDSTINSSSHRFYARAYTEYGKASAWERIAELESQFPVQSSTQFLAAKSGTHSFVSKNRIFQLKTLTPTNFDLCKLVRLCEEINIAYNGGALMATVMLTRAIIDHVPPIFGQQKFKQVVNNYSGSRSFKETMDRLENAARKIADGHLHNPIRENEALPEPQQVNFKAEVDVLLSEIVRILS